MKGMSSGLLLKGALYSLEWMTCDDVKVATREGDSSTLLSIFSGLFDDDIQI